MIALGVVGLFSLDKLLQSSYSYTERMEVKAELPLVIQSLKEFSKEQKENEQLDITPLQKVEAVSNLIGESKLTVQKAKKNTEQIKSGKQSLGFAKKHNEEYRRILIYYTQLEIQYKAAKDLEASFADKNLSAGELEIFASKLRAAKTTLEADDESKHYFKHLIEDLDDGIGAIELGAKYLSASNLKVNQDKLMETMRFYEKDSKYIEAQIDSFVERLSKI